MLDNPKVSCWFFTTVILGLIGAIDWLAPPVFAVIATVCTGTCETSLRVSPNSIRLSLTL